MIFKGFFSMVTENSRWIPPDSPSLCTGREWALVICTFLHCKICTPRMRVCFPQRALGRQNSIFSLEIPSITITSSKPSSGLAFGQNLKPPPSYFWFITAANQVLLKVCGLFPSSVIVTGDEVRKRNCFSATIR